MLETLLAAYADPASAPVRAPLIRTLGFDAPRAALRAEFKDNPEALRAARAEAHFRTSNYNADIQQIEAKSLSAMYDMYNNKMSPEAIKKSEEYVNAGPKAKMQFNKMMDDDLLRREQIAATRASRASAEESRAYTKIMRDAHILERTNLADTLTWLDPNKVRGLPEERIKMLQGQIGLENTPAEFLGRLWESHPAYTS